MMLDGIQRRPGVWLSAFVLLVSVAWILPELVRDDIYDGDAAHHVYWAYAYADPALFPDDFASEYFAHPSIVPPGYDLLYRGMAKVLDVQVAGELLAAALFALSLFLAYRVGTYANTDVPVLSGTAMMLLITVAITELSLLPPMGLQRAFALPLTLTAVLALQRSMLPLLGVVFLLSALIYPIVCATLGVCTIFYLAPRLVRDRRLPEGWLPLAILGSIALALIARAGSPESVGPMATLAEAMSMPEFGRGGRQPLFGEGFRSVFAHHRTGLGFPLRWVAVTIAVLAFLAWRKHLARVPTIAWSLLGAALLVWLVARFAMFTLYLPQRHTVWALPVGLGILIAAAVPAVRDMTNTRLTRLAVVFAALAVVAIQGATALEQWRTPRDHDLDAAYEFLQTLPPETLVAAHPLDADDVPMRARRSVLVSRETSISFMLGYYSRAKERLAAALAATYATDWCTVDSLGARWGVDVFLVTPAPWQVQGYDEPFNTQVQKLMQQGESEGFVLRNPPRERLLFQSGDVSVVRVDECTPGR